MISSPSFNWTWNPSERGVIDWLGCGTWNCTGHDNWSHCFYSADSQLVSHLSVGNLRLLLVFFFCLFFLKILLSRVGKQAVSFSYWMLIIVIFCECASSFSFFLPFFPLWNLPTFSVISWPHINVRGKKTTEVEVRIKWQHFMNARFTSSSLKKWLGLFNGGNSSSDMTV